jgi:hypothetical protein
LCGDSAYGTEARRGPDFESVEVDVQTGELRSWGTELWSKTKGGGWAMSGFNNAWVAGALAKEFIKVFDSATK